MRASDATLEGPKRDVTVQVYEPHKAGLPPLTPYIRDLWSRRHFAAAYSRAGIRAANTQTFFGQMWLVINPLLLALVYFLLVVVIRGGATGDFSIANGIEYLAHITAGLFLFTLVTGAIQTGAASITGGGKLILNIPFPRLLMPLAAVRTAFFRFLPTLPVFIVIRLLAGAPWNLAILLSVYFLFMAILLSVGLAAFFATTQVYFRDTTSFLPYFTRIWLYLSPVLWLPAPAYEKLGNIVFLNPMYPILGGWDETALLATVPPLPIFIWSAVWAVVILVGGSLFFMSRERDFAVRV